MKAVIFALVLLGVSLSTHTEDVVSLIEKIDATPFGHTLFETIFIQLESGDPLDTLLSTLSDLEDRYVAEQKQDDALNREFQLNCDGDIAALDKDLAESNNVKITLEAKLEGQLYPQRSILQGIVNAKANEAKALQKDIDELDNERAEANSEFETKVKEHEEAIAIITEARRLFESLVAPSFLEKKGKTPLNGETLSLIQKNLHEGARRVNKFKHRKSYAQFMKILATISSKAQQLADGGHLQRIIDLANELLAKIQQSLDLERFAEDKRVEAYQKTRRLLVVVLTQTNTDLANLRTELASVNDNIARTEASLSNTNQRIDNLNERRSDRWNECEEAAHDYQQARSSRDADRQTVSDAVGLVNKELRTLREQLALRLAAGDKI